eukprot:4133785-Pleurochrysis_carterae.AAC.1
MTGAPAHSIRAGTSRVSNFVDWGLVVRANHLQLRRQCVALLCAQLARVLDVRACDRAQRHPRHNQAPEPPPPMTTAQMRAAGERQSEGANEYGDQKERM